MSRYEDQTLGQAQIGESVDGAFKFQLLKFTSAAIDPASVAAAVSAEQNFTFTGLKSGDIPFALETPAAMATLQTVPTRVGADDTLTVRCTNPTAGAINIAAGQTVSVTVLRPR